MTIQDGIKAATILISAGAGLRIMILFFKMITCEETEVSELRSKIKNTIIFFIIALCATSLTVIVQNYYGV